jgi:hypothetical protein
MRQAVKKPRRQRVDSAASQTAAMQASGRMIDPPSNITMSKIDRIFFGNIIDEGAKVDWTPHRIELACDLARHMTDHEREQVLLREEGSVIAGNRGGSISNPRVTAVKAHMQTILAIRRSLGIHALARDSAQDVAKRRKVNKDNQSLVDDDLINRPVN